MILKKLSLAVVISIGILTINAASNAAPILKGTDLLCDMGPTGYAAPIHKKIVKKQVAKKITCKEKPVPCEAACPVPCNPCSTPCAPCAQPCVPCNPCPTPCTPCAQPCVPCNPCPTGAAVPVMQPIVPCNPCQTPCEPCNPCPAPCNPCD